MIVLSVALVVVAAVLLIVGLIAKGVAVIYLSIVASAVAAVLLWLGVRGSRPQVTDPAEDPAPAAPGRPADAAPVPAAAAEPARQPATAPAEPPAPTEQLPAESQAPVPTAEPVPTVEPAAPADSAAAGQDAGEPVPGAADMVTVVSGRPRYHRPGCRFLAGRDDAEEIPLDEAREVGFTSCPVCRPEDYLAEQSGRAGTQSGGQEGPAGG